jgi:hypothetical protein
MPARPKPVKEVLSKAEAAAFLVGHHGLNRFRKERGAAGVRALLTQARCIQLDPLDPWGTNADLVALARVDGIEHGDVFRHLYPGFAFEHFAKERCLLPASAFPWYREHAEAQTPWWRLSEREKRLPEGVVEAVYEELKDRGPLSADQLTDHGSVRPLDWSGWKGTGRAALMALEVLWTRCRIVVCGRGPKGKLYDVPERALPGATHRPTGSFARWAIVERVEAAGLLSRASGPTWSMLSAARTTSVPDELVEEGLLEEIYVEGSPRPYLAPAGFRSRKYPKPDDRLRILAPLDPMLWNRGLVKDVFGFDYVWEVYKPLEQRRWGWYVCPLFHEGRLVGRVEGAVDATALRVKKIWKEKGATVDDDALLAALQRHAAACRVEKVVRPKRFSSSR